MSLSGIRAVSIIKAVTAPVAQQLSWGEDYGAELRAAPSFLEAGDVGRTRQADAPCG